MSAALNGTVPRIAPVVRVEPILKRCNRIALGLLVWFEAAAQRRQDRRILARMSDAELADIGIGRSEIERTLRG